MLVLYDKGLFFNSTICGVTFDSRDKIFKVMFSLEVQLQTPNSASVSGENGKSLALQIRKGYMKSPEFLPVLALFC